MPFARSQFDPGFVTPATDHHHAWYDNLFDFSKVPWDVLFLFGLFTAIVGFLIAHWWLAQRMRKYKDRIRIVESEHMPFEPVPDPSVEFPPYHNEPTSCFIPSSSKKKVRFVEKPDIIEPKELPFEDEDQTTPIDDVDSVPAPTDKTPAPQERETVQSPTNNIREDTQYSPTPPPTQENVELKPSSSTPEPKQAAKEVPQTPKKSKAKPKKSTQTSKENEIDLIDVV